MALLSSTVTGPSKPPYVVPTLGEIYSVPSNGLKVVSTFSGCGGSCLGFKMDGYRVLWANEFVPHAAMTYEINHRGVPLDRRDIREVTTSDVRDVIGDQEIDVFEGSPPCSSFSEAGAKDKGWGKEIKYSSGRQRSDDLFYEYARLVEGLRPKVFIAENTSGLIKGVAKGYFKQILAHLKSLDYEVEAKLLDAQWLGVPQRRERVFFIGVRKDLGKMPMWPKPFPYRYVLADVLPYVRSFHRPGLNSKGIPRAWHVAAEEPMNALTTHAIRQSKKGWFSSNGFIELHTGEKRRITLDELRLVSSFPNDFELTGNKYQAWERIARAVPPRVAYALAKTIREEILNG